MNIVFFGTSEFAIPALRGLLNSRHSISALVTQPDRKKGRSLKMLPPLTKTLALTKDIPVYQPQDASSPESLEYLKSLSSDLFIVAAFGQILKKEALSVPKFYSINLHASLLPKYRGAAPTNWAIINGDKLTGVTVIKMNERMDEGDILLKRELEIDDLDTNITLSEKLSELGARALLEAVDLIENKKAIFTKQDVLEARYAPKLKKEDGLIDWSQTAIQIHNRVRGLVPWPGAYTHYKGKILKILRTEISNAHLASEKNKKKGEVAEAAEDKGIVVQTGSGNLVIKYLQLEGKKALDAASFLRGHRIEPSFIFE